MAEPPLGAGSVSYPSDFALCHIEYILIQYRYQLADAVTGFIYSAALSILILCLMEVLSRWVQPLSFLSPVEKEEGSRPVDRPVDDEVEIAESHDQRGA